MDSNLASRSAASERQGSRAVSSGLEVLDPSKSHSFLSPVKKINDGQDVSSFLSSRAYTQIMTFLFQLNGAMYPRHVRESDGSGRIQAWELGTKEVTFSHGVVQLQSLLQKLEDIIEEAPPDSGPQRFGNTSFRKWFQMAESQTPKLLEQYLPSQVFSIPRDSSEGAQVEDELSSYLLGSFGSAQRLDYGTGHELSFLAFLGCIWMLGGFPQRDVGVEERGIVLGVIEPYLHLVRRLIETYNLEPAGSHGVWGLDDHSFLPYILGSAQFSPAISSLDQLPAEGSLADAADPGDVAKAAIVERERKRNMYFAAVGFIYDMKKGPFWEHSPILYDISGVRAGWAKINKGMIKMYNAEVLSKFPVVQHFSFGSLFSWERDPNAPPPSQSVHTSSQPAKPMSRNMAQGGTPSAREPPQGETKAPWATPGVTPTADTSASTRAPWAKAGAATGSGHQVTKAPWASNGGRAPPPASWGAPPGRAA